jgi:hypothetical protein
MKIFIGSSRESLPLVHDIEVWLEDQGHEPIPWDKPGLFMPGVQTFTTLIQISRTVEAAVLVFGEDDKVWYRGDTAPTPRDNVLIEYGLLGGALGPQKAIICRAGDPRHPIDLAGLTYIDLSPSRRARGKVELSIWARSLTTSPTDPAMLKLRAKIFELEREKERLVERLSFETDKAQGLKAMLKRENVVDLSDYDLAIDGHWKLLFEYDYFHEVSAQIARVAESPVELERLFRNAGAGHASGQLAWTSPGDPSHKVPERNPQRNVILARKVLRLLRDGANRETYSEFIRRAPTYLRESIDDAASVALSRLQPEDTALP